MKTACLTPDDQRILLAALTCYAKAKNAEFAKTPEHDARARRDADNDYRAAMTISHLIEYCEDITVTRGTPVCDQPD